MNMGATVKIELGARDLVNALGNLTAFASKPSDHAPVLEHLMIEFSASDMVAYATDRYRLARTRHRVASLESSATDPGSNGPEFVTALMHRDIAEQFSKALKAEKFLVKNNLNVPLEVVLEAGEVMEWSLMLNGSRHVRSAHSETRGLNFPNIQSLFPSEDPRDLATAWAVNPKFMIDMMKVKDHALSGPLNDREPVRFITPSIKSDGRIVGSLASYRFEWFECVLMPCRVVDNKYANYRLADAL